MTMTTEQFQKIEQILHYAKQVKAEDLTVFLDAVCAGDEELRQEVDGLINSLDGPSHFALS